MTKKYSGSGIGMPPMSEINKLIASQTGRAATPQPQMPAVSAPAPSKATALARAHRAHRSTARGAHGKFQKIKKA
jgi:hypothetical protein